MSTAAYRKIWSATAVRRIKLFFAVGDASLGQIVWGNLDRDLVTRQNTNEMQAHLAGNRGDDLMPILQLDAEGGVGKQFLDGSFDFDAISFGHK